VILRVRLFAILRERAGSEEIELELADGATVADAMKTLAELPSLAGLLERLPVRMAVNREYSQGEKRLFEHDELALIPPLSGGVDIHARITTEPLSLDDLTRSVTRPGAGAIVVFQGMPRDVDRLEYEAYREMAEERITAILADCFELHDLRAIAAEHRVGSVQLSEPSVIVAAAAAHRAEAFAGARQAIDRIKAEAPVWKREIDTDGRMRRPTGVAPTVGPPEEPPAVRRAM
jgi:molybdopterin synthase catalytic subunit/molybdopterin converting factor small subunit